MCKKDLHEHNHDHNHEHKHSHDGMEHEHEHCHSHAHPHDHKHCHEDSHDGDHKHCHEDEHVHRHECKCGSSDNDNLSKEEKTLKLLLNHWIEHNKAHEEGFKEWVQKAKSMGQNETGNFIQKAVEFMEKADEMLIEAEKSI